jgi:hypothetical protein
MLCFHVVKTAKFAVKAASVFLVCLNFKILMVNADAPKNSIGTQSASYVLISKSVLMVNGSTVKIYVKCVLQIAFRALVQLRTVLLVRHNMF